MAVGAGLLIASHASAQAVVTVTPADLQGWGSQNGGSGSSEITSTQPRSGNGSLELSTYGPGDRTRFGAYNPGGIGWLSSLDVFSFDWFRSSVSTTADHFTPAFRLHVYDPATEQSSELIWEGVYNGLSSAPEDTWVATDGMNELFWRWVTGVGYTSSGGAQVNLTPGAWSSSGYYSEQAVVWGVSAGAGSGMTGTFTGFADNISLGFERYTAVTWNFETAEAVPEPASMALLFTGLIGVGGVAYRRRKKVGEA